MHTQQGGSGAAGVRILFLRPWYRQYCSLERRPGWSPPPHMGKALGGFQTQVAIQLTGRILQRTQNGKWRYTSSVTTREEAGFLTMEEYIRRGQNTVPQ